MWYGVDTKELIELKKAYEEIFGADPDGEMSLEYGQKTYSHYVRDLKECIDRKITLGDLYPEDEDAW